MREFQEKRRFRKLLHSRYVIAVLFILCVLLVRAVWGIYGKYEKSREISDRTRGDLAALSARREFLTREIADLNTDLGRESEIRKRFGTVREGEKLIVLVDDKSDKKSATQSAGESWWNKLTGFFGF
ncbi:MAG TPA: septum formation initiator family protein [Candidatus Paceibacterota bacterium]